VRSRTARSSRFGTGTALTTSIEPDLHPLFPRSSLPLSLLVGHSINHASSSAHHDQPPQDAPNLPRRPIERRTLGRVFAGRYRPSTFLTLTLDSYGRVDSDGAAADPDRYDYRRAARDAIHFPAVSSPARPRSLALAARAADRVASYVGSDPAAAEMYGMLHLTCALNAAALRRSAESAHHQAEAADVAARVGSGTNFGHQGFGLTNYGFWTVHLAVERREGGKVRKVRELAREVDTTGVASASRRAAYYADLGRGLATERGLRHEAVAALRTAEKLAPQRVRANPFGRDVVTDLMRRARRDAIGRELRGMAYRMGLAAG
jgi:hypothetical protein